MYLVAIAWLYVALMMAVAEATSTQGSLLGAVVTFLFYGLGPVSLVMYLLGTPARRRAQRAALARRTIPSAAESSMAGSDHVAPADKPLHSDRTDA
ncbi:MAG: hypothetical protein ACK4ZD_07590 [Caldimonas sp.]|uniref:hypothetical protein n=1 Tax=Caldimonas sp. TaxID=2838790 RepID=UPI00391B62C6